MDIGGDGALWKNNNTNQVNKKILKDNINPNKRVYIVLFIMQFIRGHPNRFAFQYEFPWRANTMKNDKCIKFFLKKVGKIGIRFRDYNTEAQNLIQNFLNKEKTVMNDKSLTVNQFKKYVRKSLHNFRIDMYRKHKKIYEKEFLTDELPFVEKGLYDDYDFLENKVVVMDFKMTVKNDLLYEVLNSMEQHQRDIIYLSICEEMSDMEIGRKLRMSRSKVQRIKQKVKKEIYCNMIGGEDDD